MQHCHRDSFHKSCQQQKPRGKRLLPVIGRFRANFNGILAKCLVFACFYQCFSGVLVRRAARSKANKDDTILLGYSITLLRGEWLLLVNAVVSGAARVTLLVQDGWCIGEANSTCR